MRAQVWAARRGEAGLGIDRRHMLVQLAVAPLALDGAGAMTTAAQSQPAAIPALVQTGADRLAADGFRLMAGQRVGLITNHTGRIGPERLLDVMARAPGVALAAILTPEHGLSGTVEAGAKVSGGKDRATRIPVHSLYGATLKPTRAMLDGLDVLVFDMQDIGTRYYTYISTMGLAMQAAAEAGLPFVVLDRPNPLGGDMVAGFVLERAVASFVGRYEIPQVHGLTVGELARMIKGEALLPGLQTLHLDVVAMEGWQRSMRWPATELPWIATSPNIPTFETALAYAGTGLFEATTASEGRGTPAPFLTLGHVDADPAAIVSRVSAARLAGVAFEPVRVTPRAIKGVAQSPRFRDREIGAVRLRLTDAMSFAPVETGITLLAAFAEALRSRGTALLADTAFFDKLAGSKRLSQALVRGVSAHDIVGSWLREVAEFRQRRTPYLLY